MRLQRLWRMRLLCIVLCIAAQPAPAITIQINYTYDTGNFFGAGNPLGATAGAQAKAALEAGASFYSTILTDTFDAITVPPPYQSNAQGSTGVVTWSWQATFKDPTTNGDVSLTNLVVGSDQYVIFAGARSLDPGIAGRGGPGGYVTASTTVTGTNSFTQGDQNNINALTASLNQAITTRGETSGFAKWGGTISFDNDGSTPWFFNHLGTPSGNVTDFYSIAIHELGHTLGFGVSSEWNALVNSNLFFGINAENQNSGNAVPVAPPPNQGHWAFGTQSVVYGTLIQQEAAMDPDLQNGMRKKLTALDAAGLQDIGWSLGPAPGVSGDYNNNGVVDAGDYVVWRKRLNQNVTLPNDTTPGTVTAADYTVWRANFGKVPGSGSGALFASGEIPEPASGFLATILGLYVYFNCRTLRR